MPSVFTIQGPDLNPVEETYRSIQRKKRSHEERTNVRVMDELCDLRSSLMNKAAKTKAEYKHRAYQAAGDALQQLVEGYPGGHEYFWSGRCGTKKRRR
jgi:hypothetical protein